MPVLDSFQYKCTKRVLPMATCMLVTLPTADVVSSAIEFTTASTVWSSEDDMLISSFVSFSCAIDNIITYYANHVILQTCRIIPCVPAEVSLTLGNTNECCTG